MLRMIRSPSVRCPAPSPAAGQASQATPQRAMAFRGRPEAVELTMV